MTLINNLSWKWLDCKMQGRKSYYSEHVFECGGRNLSLVNENNPEVAQSQYNQYGYHENFNGYTEIY